MSRYILNPQHLEKLPLPVQDYVNGLNDTQLSHLQAAFSNYAFFDFLGLPQELRLLICKFALADHASHVHRGKGTPLPSIGMFTASKQIGKEALLVFKESKQCMIKFGMTHRILPSNSLCLRYFRHFILEVPVNQIKFILLPKYDRLCRFLGKVHQHLLRRRKRSERDSKFTLHINFAYIGGLDEALGHEDLDVFHPQQDYLPSVTVQSLTLGLTSSQSKYVALYYKAQLQKFVCHMRVSLEERLPNAKISSNVDTEWPDMDVLEVTPSSVKFYDKKKQKAGLVSNRGDGWDVAI